MMHQQLSLLRDVARLPLSHVVELAQPFSKCAARKQTVRGAALRLARVGPPGGRRASHLPRRRVSVIRFTSRKERQTQRQAKVRKKRRDPRPPPTAIDQPAVGGA